MQYSITWKECIVGDNFKYSSLYFGYAISVIIIIAMLWNRPRVFPYGILNHSPEDVIDQTLRGQ